MIQSAIKYFIFDLGGVFIDINYHATRDAFLQLGFSNFNDFYGQSHSLALFEQLETGKILPNDFYEATRKTAQLPSLDNNAIQMAWNAMLGQWRVSSLEFAWALKQKYPVYLLSNTNAIHVEAIQASLTQLTGHSLAHYFTKIFLSNEVQLRKPNADIYEYVLADIGAKPNEAVFIDDTKVNIDAAATLGIHTYWLQPDERIESIYQKYLQP